MSYTQPIASQVDGCINGSGFRRPDWGRVKSSGTSVTPGVVRAVVQQLTASGVIASTDIEAFWKLVKVRDRVARGQTIVDSTASVARFTVLLEGVACLSVRHDDGARQIQTFYHAGDFLDLQNFLFPQTEELSEVKALTGCFFGTIDRNAMDQAIQCYPVLGQALWRAAFTEMAVFRQRLVTSRRPALQRVAHLLSELLVRLGADQGVIPLTQIDVADAAGLSVVHVNRVFQELREFGVLAQQRLIKVVNRKRLQELAAFDAGYLNPGEASSRWNLRLDQ